jgi:autotransporter-associated beta strand protein
VTIGSIEGTGSVFLGANNLTTGSNNLSTIFSGTIQDGGISGGTGGSLTKIGTGTLMLTAANSYTGGTVVNAGILSVGYTGNDGKSTLGNSNLTINNGATVRVDTTNALGFSGNEPAITVNAGGLLTASSGVTQHLSSLTLSGGTLASAAPSGLGAFYGTYNLDNNLTSGGATTTSVISALFFALTTPGGTTFTVNPGAANGIDLDVPGTIGAPVGVTNTALFKAGAGVMRLSNANTYTSPTTVVSGILEVANDGISTFGTLGTGPVTVIGAPTSGGNYGTLKFTDFASAGNGTLTNNGAGGGGGSGGLTMFIGASTAGHATIHNLATAFNASGGGGTAFSDDATAGFAVITSDGAFQYRSGFTEFANRATLGNAEITNNGCSAPFLPPAEVLFQDDSTAGNGTINNGASTSANGAGGLAYFSGSAFAGTAAITNLGGMFAGNTSGTTQFFGASSADHSVIHNQSAQANAAPGGATQFYDASTAGSATVINQRAAVSGGLGGQLQFNNTATAGHSTIVNEGVAITFSSSVGSGTTSFLGNATGGSASISNEGAGIASAYGGQTNIGDSATAGGAMIANGGGRTQNGLGGYTLFYGTGSAGGATITNSSGTAPGAQGGVAYFSSSGNAGSATITNAGGQVSSQFGGRTELYDTSAAAAANITNAAAQVGTADGGVTNFHDTASAGTASITNNGGILSGGFGGYVQFFNTSTADHSVIHNQGATVIGASSGITFFYGNSSAGSATLYADAGIGNGGGIIFLDSSDGGTARAVIGGSGLDSGGLDLSLLTTAGMNLGSLEGAGITSLGNKNLSVGGNNLSNTYSGIIRDGGYSGATGGSLTKVGAGTLTLEGVNTYTGNTMVSAGTLKFDLNSGPATVASGVTATVAAGATLELAGSVSALGTAGGNRVHVVNGSTAAGIVVSGTNQVVGNIDGSGSTQVNAGSDLTANHIIQSALVIGGAGGNPALVTIAASDASGDPLDSLAFPVAAITSDAPFGAGVNAAGPIGDSTVGAPIADLSAQSDSNTAARLSAVPEPSGLVILAIGAVALIGAALSRQRHSLANVIRADATVRNHWRCRMNWQRVEKRQRRRSSGRKKQSFGFSSSHAIESQIGQPTRKVGHSLACNTKMAWETRKGRGRYYTC